MKKIFICLLGILLLSGCSLKDDFKDNYIYTTMYPIEYATNFLYSDYADIKSVYPDGVDSTYQLTTKKKEKYSDSEMFIYSGVAKEAYLAKDLLNNNGKIKLIDATKGLNSDNGLESTWLDPSNYLMLCSNIKSNLVDYNTNVYIKENIEEKYKELNEKISEIDVELYNIGKNGKYNTLLVTNDLFKYLTKYNINVISIDEKNQSLDKAYADARNLIKDKKIQYIYSLENEELTQSQNKFISDNSIVKISINDIYTMSEEERKNSKNYITLMEEIIDNYKKELYKN